MWENLSSSHTLVSPETPCVPLAEKAVRHLDSAISRSRSLPSRPGSTGDAEILLRYLWPPVVPLISARGDHLTRSRL